MVSRRAPIERMGYAALQAGRVAWYLGHYAAVNRIRGPLTPPGEPGFSPSAKLPDRRAFIGGIRSLFEQDWTNIERGLYRGPEGGIPSPGRAFAKSLAFFRDVPKVDERRLQRRHAEVLTPERRRRYPRYYLQNFHYQTDGWLSGRSADLYDTQVEVLFAGTADAMRRQALVPLAAALKGVDQRRCRLLDLAAGTGRFLATVKENYPRLGVTALDLSPAYLAKARDVLSPWRDCTFVEAAAERTGLAGASQDIVTCVYLFHELPPKVRRAVAAEIARVLKPGGRLILVDALQTGDRPDYDGLLEFFPVGFHEPYFTSYLTEDLAALMGGLGLALQSQTPAFLSKVMTFEKT